DAYSHLPVAWLPGGLAAGGGGQHADAATVLVLGTDQLADADRQATDAAAGTETLPLADSVQALPSFSSENGSLQLMRGLLLVISALVIGAFFTVWTVQRSGEIAVLKAVGASTGYLLRDALGQALVLLVLGTGLGAGAATGLGLLAAGTVPFVLDVATVAVPVLSLVALGLLGAAVSLRQIVSVDPLTALGSAR
ncbi:MAG TPA: ABC transporter permease, partial [Ruania sp.]|nr:ABC transporter permease [Ruania sp.]